MLLGLIHGVAGNFLQTLQLSLLDILSLRKSFLGSLDLIVKDLFLLFQIVGLFV